MKIQEQFKMNAKEVDITKVRPNSWNPKDVLEESEENQKQFEQIKKSIQEHGFMLPLIVRSVQDEEGYYEIIDGYHRWRAADELGYTKVLVNDLGNIDDVRAKALTLIFERAKIDINAVKEAGLVKEIYEIIGDVDEMAKILPYSSEIINNKIELINFDWDRFEEGEGDIEDGIDNSQKFRFTVENPEEADICNDALTKTGNEYDEAFIELCRFYINNRE